MERKRFLELPMDAKREILKLQAENFKLIESSMDKARQDTLKEVGELLSNKGTRTWGGEPVSLLYLEIADIKALCEGRMP